MSMKNKMYSPTKNMLLHCLLNEMLMKKKTYSSTKKIYSSIGLIIEISMRKKAILLQQKILIPCFLIEISIRKKIYSSTRRIYSSTFFSLKFQWKIDIVFICLWLSTLSLLEFQWEKTVDEYIFADEYTFFLIEVSMRRDSGWVYLYLWMSISFVWMSIFLF